MFAGGILRYNPIMSGYRSLARSFHGCNPIMSGYGLFSVFAPTEAGPPSNGSIRELGDRPIRML